MIPLELVAKLNRNGFMLKCCLCGAYPVQWHHNLIYGGRQQNEEWTILPVCRFHHDNEKKKEIKEQLDWIMLNRATDDELKRFSKVDNLIAKREMLNKKFPQGK